MLLAEVMYAQKWYPLQIPPDVEKEIYDFFDLKEDDELEGWMLYRGDCPKLNTWMNRHSYRQDVVSVSYYPEVQDKEGPSNDLVERAKKLWNSLGAKTPLPPWDSISKVTQEVWIQKARELKTS